MLVYRVEHEQKGHGPYVECYGDTEWDTDCRYRFPDPQRPMPMEDGIEGLKDAHFFGFQSLIQLRSWFPPSVWERMSRVGFSVAVYRVPDTWVKVGGKQVAFRKPAAPKERIPFDQVENRIRGIVSCT
jgi:hypothetical protein